MTATFSPSKLKFWIQFITGVLFSLASIPLLLVAQPPYGIWPLAFLGFIPMMVAQHRLLPRRISSLAPAIGIGGFLGILIPSIFGKIGSNILWIQLLPVGIFLIVLVMDSGNRRLHERTGYRWFVLEGALTWVGIEMIRNLIPFIGTGGFIGYAYYRSPWLIQPVSIFGIFGINLLTMLLAYTLGLGAISLYDRAASKRGWSFSGDSPSVPPKLVRSWLAGMGVACVAWITVSLVLYFAPSTNQVIKVAAVQPAQQENLVLLGDLSRQAADQGAKLIVWPEGVLHSDPRKIHTSEIQEIARQAGAYLAFGYGFQTGNGLRNEATLLSPQGEFLGIYGKDHPIIFMGETSLTQGKYPVYQTENGPIGTIICFDLNFVDSARKLVANGARLLAVPSNDWPELYNIQYAYLVFRAVENRVPAIKADTNYDSLVIDARGRLVASRFSPQGTQAVVVADVPLGTGNAPELFLGDWVGWISLAGLLFFALPNPLIMKKH